MYSCFEKKLLSCKQNEMKDAFSDVVSTTNENVQY